MSARKRPQPAAPHIDCDVVRQIRQHARSCSKTEVCGVLIGREIEGVMTIAASIPGANATQGGTHVTFTQDTWEHIYKIKDREYPDNRIIGWYHSHPGFGVFLSDHDTFIHKNFFSSPQQVAWVYDPHSDEEGCFGWVEDRVERLAHLVLVDGKGGELAGESGKPEPTIVGVEDEGGDSRPSNTSGADSSSAPSVSRTVATFCSYLSVFLLGILVAWYVFPRVIVMGVPVDPRTGQRLAAPVPTPGNDAADRAMQSSPQQNDTKGNNGRQ